MHPLIRNVLAVILGAVIGAAVNMGFIIVGPSIIPAPAGVDVTSMESISASIHLFAPKHFVFPFLAHALGTLVGAMVASLVAASHQRMFAYLIGCLFLVGGIVSAFIIPAPVWFLVLDLVGAYLPMAWLGEWLLSKFPKVKSLPA